MPKDEVAKRKLVLVETEEDRYEIRYSDNPNYLTDENKIIILKSALLRLVLHDEAEALREGLPVCFEAEYARAVLTEFDEQNV